MSALYDLVARYAGFGDHRTGTDVDAATVNWLADLLTGRGAEVVRQPYAFPQFMGRATGSGSAEGVQLEPLYYSATGSHNDDGAYVASIEFDDDHGDAEIGRTLGNITRQAKAAGARIAIAATRTASGGLCAINRTPAPPGEIPVCLAPGQALDQLRAGQAGVRFEAEIRTGRSENLSALFRCETNSRPPLIVTTPLSGWFACAGERGTGLAIAISLAEELSRQISVLLVMPTGHELGYCGAARFVEAFDRKVTGVLHLGSCIADETALGGDGAMRAVSNLDGAPFAQVCKRLANLNIVPERPLTPTMPGEWIGESELWAPRGDPMISIAGTSHTFHTPEDLAEAVTNPELLERVRSCVLPAAQALIA